MEKVYRNGKLLRCGYTTGSCAAAATKQAVRILLGLTVTEAVEIRLPKGEKVSLPVFRIPGEEWEAYISRTEGGSQPVANVSQPEGGSQLVANVSQTEGNSLTAVNISREEDGFLPEANSKQEGSKFAAYPASRQVGHTEFTETVCCAVRKEAGDDADVTDGLMICAAVMRTEGKEYRIDGGVGVGRVSRAGLDQEIGLAAINTVPRQMIREVLQEAAEQAGYDGGLEVIIFVPEGERVAAGTFNPRLGIVGGISILGTSGIVEPMSDQALVDTIRTELRVFVAEGRKKLLMTPGNYGEDFIRQRLGLELDSCVKCSNFIGDALDAAVEYGVEELLLIGHIGKLVKLGSGIMNTHSRFADGRMETLSAFLLRAGGDAGIAREVLDCVTTEEAIPLMRKECCFPRAMELLTERMEEVVDRRVYGRIRTGVVCFSTKCDLCLVGASAGEILKEHGVNREKG